MVKEAIRLSSTPILGGEVKAEVKEEWGAAMDLFLRPFPWGVSQEPQRLFALIK